MDQALQLNVRRRNSLHNVKLPQILLPLRHHHSPQTLVELMDQPRRRHQRLRPQDRIPHRPSPRRPGNLQHVTLGGRVDLGVEDECLHYWKKRKRARVKRNRSVTPGRRAHLPEDAHHRGLTRRARLCATGARRERPRRDRSARTKAER